MSGVVSRVLAIVMATVCLAGCASDRALRQENASLQLHNDRLRNQVEILEAELYERPHTETRQASYESGGRSEVKDVDLIDNRNENSPQK